MNNCYRKEIRQQTPRLPNANQKSSSSRGFLKPAARDWWRKIGNLPTTAAIERSSQRACHSDGGERSGSRRLVVRETSAGRGSFLSATKAGHEDAE